MHVRLFSLLLAAPALVGGQLEAQTPDWVRRVLAAAELPTSADQVRKEGVPNSALEQVLGAMQAANVPAHEAHEVLDEERAAIREHGPVDNFGAFVQSKLEAGLRGRDLAAAIRAEHQLRGKGPPGRGAQSDDRGGDRGRSAEARDSAANREGRAGEGRDTTRGRQGRPRTPPGKQPEAAEGPAEQDKPADRAAKPTR
jgi:hypothetical protein